ncbi:MAG TPA: hypothetical protein PLW23_06340 [Bacteroidales bacterium]|nr:hypothetical protein [Bacteroidales bacterium]
MINILKSFLILTVFSLCINTNLKAQATAEELMDAFFQIFEEDAGAAIDYLFATNNMIDPSQPGIKSIKERLELSRKLLGDYHGYEIINVYQAGESYRKYNYSLKFERQPVKFTVVLYCPKDKWKVQNVNFQDDIDTEFSLRED